MLNRQIVLTGFGVNTCQREMGQDERFVFGHQSGKTRNDFLELLVIDQFSFRIMSGDDSPPQLAANLGGQSRRAGH